MKLTNPYQGADGPWYRGNLHTHTTESDGKLSPEDVVAMYAEHGYDFLCLSDHDKLTTPLEHEQVVGIPGVEVSAAGPHLLAVGVDRVFDPKRPRGGIVAEIMANDGLCVLCHPNWTETFAHWPQIALESVGPYHGIEIFNSVIDFLAGESLAVDRWDQLLSKGHKCWGYADDDMHDRPHAARGWNMVCASARTPEAIVEALKAGRCYASTGVTIERITLEDETLTIVAPNASELRFCGRWGQVKQFSEGPEASYQIKGQEGYVRVSCLGAGSQAAWTQPIYVEAE